MNRNIIISFFLIVFFIPLFFILWQILNGLFEHIGLLQYFITRQFFNKIYNSLMLCFGVSITSIVLALFATFSFFSMQKLYWRQIFFLLLFALFSIAPIISLTALSKLFWFNHLSIYLQSLLVLSIKLFPLGTMIIIFSFSRINALSIKISLMVTSFKNVLKYIILPQLYKSILIAFLIIFMLTFTHEAVPSFLGYRTYAEDFLSHMIVMDNIKEISFMTIPFLLLGVLVLTISLKTIRTFIDDDKFDIYIFPNFQKFALFFSLLITMLVFFLHFLLIRELFNENIQALFVDNFDSLKNSILFSLITGVLGTIIGVLVYPFIYSCSIFIKVMLSLLMLLYWLLPSALSSIGLIELSSYLNQYNTFIGYILMLFAYLIKILPIAFLLLSSFKVIEISDIFLKLQNISSINILKYISIPLEWVKWFIIVIILTIFSLNELSSTILLIPPGQETIIVKIYNLMHYGDFSSVAFLSLVQMNVILIFIVTIGLLLRKQYDYS